MGDDALLGPAELRALAAALGVRPRKALGQNFVVDPNTVRRIVRTADLRPDDVVLEVGPGLGSLTLGLLGAAAKVVAVEVDPALAAALPATVAAATAATDPAAAARLRVVAADALRLPDLGGGDEPSALVANLPYNVAVPVLLSALARFPSLAHGLVMVQAEVADRLVAAPGSRTYGAPSVKLAYHARAWRAGAVPRAVFWPVPNVDSALVAFRRHDPPAGTASPASPASTASTARTASTDRDRERLFAVVDAAFAQRRKTLRAALAGWAGSAAAAEVALRRAGVDPALRGEQLDVAAFARIAAVTPPGGGGTAA